MTPFFINVLQGYCPRLELITFDTHKRCIIEAQGAIKIKDKLHFLNDLQRQVCNIIFNFVTITGIGTYVSITYTIISFTE